jgi:cell division protein FtsQ
MTTVNMATVDVRPRRSPAKPTGAARFAERKRRDRRRRWVRRVLILLVLGALGWGVWAVGWSSLYGVRQVSVTGNHRSSTAHLKAIAAVPVGRPMVRLDTRAIAHRIAQVPTVAHVSVHRIWPHTVRIDVTDRVPVAVVRRGAARRLIDASGVDFAPAPRKTPYPLLDLDVGTAPRQDVVAGLALVHDLPTAIAKQLSSIEVFDPTDVQLFLADQAKVYWGNASRTADKAVVLAALRAKDPKGTVFDVSAPDAPTVR